MFSKQFAICCINEVQYIARETSVGNIQTSRSFEMLFTNF